MLVLYDYLPSRNGWKIRQLLRHLGRPHRTEYLSLFEGEGQTTAFRRISPAGTVPAILLEDGRALAESNPILFYLAEGTPYLPGDAFGRAKVLQWMAFEQERIESQVGSLRFWTMTGKIERRAPALVEAKRAAGQRALAILDGELAARPFITGGRYTVADIALFAYASLADEADGLSLAPYAHVRGWIERVAAQPGFLAEVHPYAIDPHSGGDL
jgi:glutathione S-transferase